MLNNRIKEARKKAGFGIEEFAEALKIGRTTLINYEKGLSEPNVSKVREMSEKCNVNEWWLLTGKGSMYLEEKKSNGNVDTGFQDCEINNNKGSIAINISKSDFKDDSAEVEELISLLKYAPKSFIIKIIEKLRAFKELSQI